LSKVTDGSGTYTISELTEMNAFNQSTKYDRGNGIESQNFYNQFGMPTRFYASGVQDLNLSFDISSGNLLSRNDAIKGVTETFEFDDLNRLTKADPSTQPAQEMIYQNNGNILSKTDVGAYTYDGTKKNAVINIDNIPGTISPIQQDITFNNSNLAESITEGSYSYNIHYGSDLLRRKSELSQFGVPLSTKFYLGNYEKEVTAEDVNEVHYIHGSDGLVAMYVIENGVGNYFYPYTDHLGSILTVTDATGDIIAEQSFDSWGRYRNPDDWGYEDIAITNPSWLWRGFTGHEHLPQFALINMNARLYDPLLGRMLSPDNYTQNPFYSQNFDRYGYAFNNPLKYTDPTGDWFGLDDLGAFLIGGIINLYQNWDNIDNFGEGLLAFSSGGMAGTSSLYGPGGWALGGAIVSASNEQIAGGGVEEIIASTLTGTFSGMFAGAIGSSLGNAIGSLAGSPSNKIMAGFIKGGLGGGLGSGTTRVFLGGMRHINKPKPEVITLGQEECRMNWKQ
jgi:RHS repeat-associated protein